MPVAPDPMIGLPIVGSYVIREKIAEGGMGAVYVAVNDLGQKKVVKFLLSEFSRNETIRERFRREAIAAARLADRPHIVKIDDVGSLPDGRQFMTMEFLHGRTLQEHTRRVGRLSTHQALHLVAQIGRGLFELHKAGIVHRDLKPGNIFLTRTDDNPQHVKLIDLGIAHDATIDQGGFRTQAGTTMGTPGYMAPEQYGSAGDVTPSADLYALAIILWEMIAGDLPWGVHDDRVLYFKQMSEPPRLPPGVVLPPAWEAILRLALAPRPADRPQSIYQLLSALATDVPADTFLREPSGPEIVERFAGSVIRNAGINDLTLRASGSARAALMSSSITMEPLRLPLPAPHPSEPPQIVPSRPTTLGSSAGATAPESVGSRRGGWLVAGITCAVLVGATSYGVVRSAKPSADARGVATVPQLDVARIAVPDAGVPAVAITADAAVGDAAPATPAISSVDAGVAEAPPRPIAHPAAPPARPATPPAAPKAATPDPAPPAPSGVRYSVVAGSGTLAIESALGVHLDVEHCDDDTIQTSLVGVASSLRAIVLGGGGMALDVGHAELVRVQRVVPGQDRVYGFWDTGPSATIAIVVDVKKGMIEASLLRGASMTSRKSCDRHWSARLAEGWAAGPH